MSLDWSGITPGILPEELEEVFGMKESRNPCLDCWFHDIAKDKAEEWRQKEASLSISLVHICYTYPAHNFL